MEFRDFTAGKDDDGRRLDRIIRIFLKDLSMGQIYKLLRKGLIKLNDKKAKPDSHVNQGDKISIAAFLFDNGNSGEENKNLSQPAPVSELKIVFENQHLLIIDKPYGRSVHGSQGVCQPGLDKDVLAYYESKKSQKSDSLAFRPGPLHRLDRNTTGLLVFSMSMEGARWFSESIKNHTVQKKYLGLAQGNIKNKELWEDKLTDSDKTDKGFYTVSQADDKNSADSRLAITTVTPLAHGKFNGNPVTLAEYAIKTGRKHQIRAQSQIHGFPLLGDKAYGSSLSQKLSREYYLHAYSLTFPENNPLELQQEIKIGLSPDFINQLECCEIENPGL